MGFSRLYFGTRGATEGRLESLGSRFDRPPVAGFARLIHNGADEVVVAVLGAGVGAGGASGGLRMRPFPHLPPGFSNFHHGVGRVGVHSGS